MIETALLFACLTFAQLPPPPPPPPPMPARPRDTSAEVKGTSSIKGRVTTADGRPLRRASVSASASELKDPRSTTTGLEGEYELDELPAGRYTISVTRSGYLPTRYGQARYGEPGSPLQIKAGEKLEKIDFTMDRAGVISGRVLDETGEAVPGVQIWAMQSQYFRGARRLVPVGGPAVRTDDGGNYRILALPPGEYVVSGILRETWMSDEKAPRMLAYAPTYFPGTANGADAQRVKVAAGQESGAVDFSLLALSAATLSGTVAGSDGQPLATGNISLTQEVAGPTFVSMSMAGNARLDGNGAFTLRDVAPGDYTLRATGSTAGDRPTETATLKVSVLGSDMTGLVLTADAGVMISGQVVSDTGEPLPSERLGVTTGLISMENSSVRGTPGVDDGIVGPDGTFARRSMTGTVVFRLGGLPRGWGLKQVMIGGKDYAGLPIEVRAGQTISGVTAVVSKRLPTIRGRVLDDDGKPTAGVVVVFPTDTQRWHEASATIRSSKSDQAGVFQFDTMRPGEYFAVAIAYVQQWQINDPEFLASLRERATKVAVGDETPVHVDLKVVR